MQTISTPHRFPRADCNSPVVSPPFVIHHEPTRLTHAAHRGRTVPFSRNRCKPPPPRAPMPRRHRRGRRRVPTGGGLAAPPHGPRGTTSGDSWVGVALCHMSLIPSPLLACRCPILHPHASVAPTVSAHRSAWCMLLTTIERGETGGGMLLGATRTTPRLAPPTEGAREAHSMPRGDEGASEMLSEEDTVGVFHPSKLSAEPAGTPLRM